MNDGALVIGSSIASLQTTLDLADSGITVHLAHTYPFLSKNIPPGIPKQDLNSRLLEVLHHPHITALTNTDIGEIRSKQDTYQVDLLQNPRYVDRSLWTGCGTCAAHCPSGAIAAGCSTGPQLEAILATILV